MLSKTRVIMIVIFIGSFLVIPVRALLQQRETEVAQSLPEGNGKELVSTLCTACHSLETTVAQGKSKEEWEKTVNNMVSQQGAQIFGEEAETIINYLAEYYGIETAPVSVSSDPPGKATVMNKCFGCHGDARWRNLRVNRRGWEGVIYRMVGRGALWTEEEISSMTEYFSQALGPETAEAP